MVGRRFAESHWRIGGPSLWPPARRRRGGRKGWATSAKKSELVERQPCGQCGKVFATRQVLAAREFKAHGSSTAVRWHASVSFCPVCLLESRNRDRFVARFDKSGVCRTNLLLNHPRLSPEEFEALQTYAVEQARALWASGRARCHAAVPCYRLQGPLPLAVAPATVPWGHDKMLQDMGTCVKIWQRVRP